MVFFNNNELNYNNNIVVSIKIIAIINNKLYTIYLIINN